MLDDPRYIVGDGAADNGVSLGALLELLLIIANKLFCPALQDY